MSREMIYEVGDRVEYMSYNVTVYDGAKLKGLLLYRIGIIKAVRRGLFGRKYYIVRAVKDGGGAMDIVSGKNIFGRVERKDKKQ